MHIVWFLFVWNVFIYPISFLLENNPYICPCIINLMTNDTYEDIEFYENAILIGSYSST